MDETNDNRNNYTFSSFNLTDRNETSATASNLHSPSIIPAYLIQDTTPRTSRTSGAGVSPVLNPTSAIDSSYAHQLQQLYQQSLLMATVVPQQHVDPSPCYMMCSALPLGSIFPQSSPYLCNVGTTTEDASVTTIPVLAGGMTAVHPSWEQFSTLPTNYWMHVGPSWMAQPQLPTPPVTTTSTPSTQPTLVNPKQYTRILKRREARQRAEEFYSLQKWKKKCHPGETSDSANHVRKSGHFWCEVEPRGNMISPSSVLTDVNATHHNTIPMESPNDSLPWTTGPNQIPTMVQKKKYVHESRHRHALKRPRGNDGRFLTKNELEEYYKNHPDFNPPQNQDD